MTVADHILYCLRINLFQDNWLTLTGFDEEPQGELAICLTQLAHRCIAYLNQVSHSYR